MPMPPTWRRRCLGGGPSRRAASADRRLAGAQRWWPVAAPHAGTMMGASGLSRVVLGLSDWAISRSPCGSSPPGSPACCWRGWCCPRVVRRLTSRRRTGWRCCCLRLRCTRRGKPDAILQIPVRGDRWDDTGIVIGAGGTAGGGGVGGRGLLVSILMARGVAFGTYLAWTFFASMDVAGLGALPRVPVAHQFVDSVCTGHVQRALRRWLDENYGAACSRVGRVRSSRE